MKHVNIVNYDKNYTPANDYWRADNCETVDLEVSFDRKHVDGYFEARNLPSLSRSVITPIIAANKRFKGTADHGFLEPVLAVYLPVTDELWEEGKDAPFLRHINEACKAIVDQSTEGGSYNV